MIFFVKLSSDRAEAKKIDLYAAMYKLYFETIRNAGLKLTDKNFCLGCKRVDYNAGVEEFLEMLKANGIRNYLLSSGLKIFLENVSIAPCFEKIFATTFTYNQDGEANGVDFLMSDKNKVVAIKKILRESGSKDDDCSDVIYVGDGLTDRYAMDFVKEHGGRAVFVYLDSSSKEMQLIRERNGADFYARANFTRESELRKYIRKVCGLEK